MKNETVVLALSSANGIVKVCAMSTHCDPISRPCGTGELYRSPSTGDLYSVYDTGQVSFSEEEYQPRDDDNDDNSNHGDDGYSLWSR